MKGELDLVKAFLTPFKADHHNKIRDFTIFVASLGLVPVSTLQPHHWSLYNTNIHLTHF